MKRRDREFYEFYENYGDVFDDLGERMFVPGIGLIRTTRAKESDRTPRKDSPTDGHVVKKLFSKGSKGIEELEKEGQREVIKRAGKNLPVQGTTHEDEKHWIEAGFKLGPTIKDDPLFRGATWPVGWGLVETGHSMWTDIVDEKGRKRGSYGYKGAFYDRWASCHLVSRFHVTQARYTEKLEHLGEFTALVIDRAYPESDPKHVVKTFIAPESDVYEKTVRERWEETDRRLGQERPIPDDHLKRSIVYERQEASSRLAAEWLATEYPLGGPNAYWDLDR